MIPQPSAPDSADYAVVLAPGAVRLERTLPGPIERVWAYLTESDKRKQWLGSGEMELAVGGAVEHVFRNSELTRDDAPPPAKHAAHAVESRMHGRITACEPPRILAYTWGEVEGEHADAGSEVRFELTPVGTNVRLVVTHRRLASRDGMVGVSSGWHSHLTVLAARLAGRTPPGFWATYSRLEDEYEQRIPAAATSAR